jgi:hypothetical protein
MSTNDIKKKQLNLIAAKELCAHTVSWLTAIMASLVSAKASFMASRTPGSEVELMMVSVVAIYNIYQFYACDNLCCCDPADHRKQDNRKINGRDLHLRKMQIEAMTDANLSIKASRRPTTNHWDFDTLLMLLHEVYLCKPVKKCKNNCLLMTEIHSRSQPLILDHKKKVELILPLNLHMAITHFFTRVSVCIFLWPIRRVDPVNTVRIKKMVARSTHSACRLVLNGARIDAGKSHGLTIL